MPAYDGKVCQDYDVGLVRGALLERCPANRQVLAAFDRICENYFSRAGDLIGDQKEAVIRSDCYGGIKELAEEIWPDVNMELTQAKKYYDSQFASPTNRRVTYSREEERIICKGYFAEPVWTHQQIAEKIRERTGRIRKPDSIGTHIYFMKRGGLLKQPNKELV